MRTLIPGIVALLLSGDAAAQKTVSFPTEDGGVIYADVYGEGDRGVVLAHGGRFNKKSWEKQARTLAAAEFRVLALDATGYGMEPSRHWKMLAEISISRASVSGN